MQKENVIVKNIQVILNLIQYLQRGLLRLVNDKRRRCQIKFGMSSLFNNDGFTLIELLVVVLIIGILAAVAVPQYQKAVMRSRYNALKNLTTSIKNAQEVYYLQYGKYADSFAVLDIDMPGEKLADSSHNSYRYSWGSCFLNTNQSQCSDSKIQMQFQHRYHHLGKNDGVPDSRVCVALKTTNLSDLKNQLCKMESKGKGTVYKQYNFCAWLYVN